MIKTNNPLDSTINPYESPKTRNISKPNFLGPYSKITLTGLVLSDLIFSKTFEDTFTLKAINYLSNYF